MTLESEVNESIWPLDLHGVVDERNPNNRRSHLDHFLCSQLHCPLITLGGSATVTRFSKPFENVQVFGHFVKVGLEFS